MTPSLLSTLTGAYFASTLILAAQVPQLLHFQGRVQSRGNPFDGPGDFKFSLVNSNGAQTFWSNDGSARAGQEPSNSVPVFVNRGAFGVTLGDTALPNMLPVPPVIFTNEDVRLRMWFREGDDRHDGKWDHRKGRSHQRDFQLLSPDQRLTAVGYAMFAANVPDGSITAAKLASNAVGPSNLSPGSVNTVHLADGAVTREKLAPGAVPPPELEDGSVMTRHLADRAVVGRKIADGTITGEKLVPSAIGPAQIAAGAVGSNHLAGGSALANLMASGQSGVPSGGIVLSMVPDSAALAAAGYRYVSSASIALAPERWELRTGPTTLTVFFSVWTGREVIAGGESYTGIPGVPITVAYARYDPRTDTWSPINVAGAPSRRDRAVAVWTGSEMLVWGGVDTAPGGLGFLRDGGIYDPRTDQWRRITTNGAPEGRTGATAVWTGSEMLVWGGEGGGLGLNTGGRYDPVRDEWHRISMSDSPTPRFDHRAVWTGEEMIIWGGRVRLPSRVAYNTGGRYGPSTDTWSPTPLDGAPGAVYAHSAVWTGTEMIVWGGDDGINPYPSRAGACFSPTEGIWRLIASLNAPAGRADHAAVWTGSEMVVWAGVDDAGSNRTLGGGGRYRLATDQWFPLTTEAEPEPLYKHSAYWTGDGVLMVGGYPSGNLDRRTMPFWRPPVVGYLYERR